MSKLKIKSQFIAQAGYTFVACDLSQAETWVVSRLANEPRMIHALSNSDIHALTASAIYYSTSNCSHDIFKSNSIGNKHCLSCLIELKPEERYIGKKCNHGFSYRMGPEKATQSVNAVSDEPPYVTVSIPQMKHNRDVWLSLYPGIKTWWRNIEEKLQYNNRTLTTTYGRSIQFFDRLGDELYKEAIAWEPQATVADHGTGMVHPELGIEGGLVGIAENKFIDTYCNMVHTAYDSVTVECPIDAVDECAATVMRLFGRPLIVNGDMFTIPCDCEVGNRLGEMERYIAK